MKKPTNINIKTALVEQCKKYYETTNTSRAVNMAIRDSLLNQLDLFGTISNQIYHLLDRDERKITQSYTIRLDDDCRKALVKITGKVLNEAVTDALIIALTCPLPSNMELGNILKTINILGSKWDVRMNAGIKQIISSRHPTWNYSAETCAGALGIHSNFSIASAEFINDDDNEKINYYRCVQKYPLELKCKCILMELSNEFFLSVKNKRHPLFDDIKIEAAAEFFYLNYMSVRNFGNTFTPKKCSTYYRKLDSIYPLHMRLKNVHISEKDIFQFLKLHIEKKDALLFIDPIYLNANVYQKRKIKKPTEKGVEFGFTEHKNLSQQLQKCKCNFIYFCRITSKREKKNGKLILSQKELEKKDIEMQGIIDDLYYDYGFYYLDISLDDGTIERIITNFEFDGATSYNKRGDYYV